MTVLAVVLDDLGAVVFGALLLAVGAVWFRFRRDPAYEDPALPGMRRMRRMEARYPSALQTYVRYGGQVFLTVLGLVVIVGALVDLVVSR